MDWACDSILGHFTFWALRVEQLGSSIGTLGWVDVLSSLGFWSFFLFSLYVMDFSVYLLLSIKMSLTMQKKKNFSFLKKI